MGRWFTILTTTALLLLALPTFGATPRASIHIRPFGFINPPGDVNIAVRIERNPANRAASMSLVSETYFSESQWQLEGENSPVTYRFQRRGLPPGEYYAFVDVYWLEGAETKSYSTRSELLTVLP